MNYSILSAIRTKEDRDYLLSEVQLLVDSLYKTQPSSFEKILETQIRLEIAELMRKDLSMPGIDRRSYLEDLQVKLKALKIFKIALPFEPSYQGIDRISEWVRKNIDTNAILDISLDRALIAGPAISYGGRYRDLSARSKMGRLFQEKKNLITGFL
jgi:hypothetical protein